MINTCCIFKALTFLFVLTVPQSTYNSYDKDIDVLYRCHPAADYHLVTDRIAAYSKYFLGKPYKLNPIGEGIGGEFDQKPLYRTDVFDCFSYVTLILALAEANNLTEFQQKYLTINYVGGKVAFVNRYHFPSDWNKANAENGYLTDITNKILDENDKPVFKISAIVIDKPQWFRKLSTDKLRALSKQVQPETSVVPYIPLSALFNKNDQPNNYLFKQIPSGAIIEIVRTNWDLTETIGTRLDISHLGFAIRTEKGLMFRAASNSQYGGAGVIDVSLVAYLQNCLKITTISGINIQAVL